jgi:uncharacterized protein
MSDAAPQDSMGSHDLDGFLTGLAAGPETVPYLEWSGLVWGSEKPRYRSCLQEKLIFDLIQERYDEISQALRNPSADREEFCSRDCDDQTLMASVWAYGFLQAMELRPEAWLPLVRHGLAGINLVPLLALYRGLADEHEVPFSTNLKQEMTSAAADMIPPCVKAIRKFWDERPDILTPIQLGVVAAGMRPSPTVVDLWSSPRERTAKTNKSEPARVSMTFPSGNSLKRPVMSEAGVRDIAGRDQVRIGWIFEQCRVGDFSPDEFRQLFSKNDSSRDDLHEAVMITDRDGMILSTNRSFTSITGYSFDEAVGQTPRMLKSSLTTPEDHAAFWSELAAKGRWHGQVWNRTRSGELFCVRQTVTALKDESDKPFGFISIFTKVVGTADRGLRRRVR